MEVITSVKEMNIYSREEKKNGKRLVLVPTMGYFHEGHLALMRRGRELGDVLVVSLFVNPTQFGPGEDFQRYPRDMGRDISLAKEVGVDILFAPDSKEMYPDGFQTYVTVKNLTKNLCGKSRPGHFQGVTTVVSKLFNIVQPDIALFGEKDYQQLITIKRMVRDLNFPVEIVSHPIVREEDGLAMSSRNAYLKEEDRNSALSLWKSILFARDLVKRGETRAKRIIEKVREIILSHPHTSIDYISIVDPKTLEDIERIEPRGLLALAVKVRDVRLIDNTILEKE